MRKDEIELHLSGRKPQDIPLARLAEYMREFAILLGQPDNVFFSKIEDGSTRILAYAKQGRDLGPAARRAVALSQGEGAIEARRARDKIGGMARTDRRRARVLRNRTTLLHISPEPATSTELKVRDRGHITGQLWGILTDSADTMKVRIRPFDGGPQVQCTASVQLAEKIGVHISKPVRAFGSGWWRKGTDEKWICESLEIESIEAVKSHKLSDIFGELRALPLEWDDDPFLDEFWRESRQA